MFAERYDDWQHTPPPEVHHRCSPNLIALIVHMQDRWPGFTNLGCFGVRPIRGGEAPSSHANGAALDAGYPAGMDRLVLDEVIPFLVARSHELHVQAVHDYRRARIWRAGRTAHIEDACGAWWRAQRASQTTGMGQLWANHLHVETNAGGWWDVTAIPDRWAGA